MACLSPPQIKKYGEIQDYLVSVNIIEDMTGDDGCGKPLEVCFIFGSMGEYYLDRNMGRVVSLDEGIEILIECRKAGLVTQPATAQNSAI